MHRVLTIADRAGAQVIAAGDLSQLPPIGAGCPMKQMIATVGTSELKTNYRQTEIEAQASKLLREGEAEKALAIYAEKGDLHVAKNRTEAANKLVSDWAKDGGLERPQAFVIIVQTNAEVSQMNRKCQNARLVEGTISPIHVRVGEDKFHVKDRVMMKETDGHRGIANSNLGTIKSIDEWGNVTVTLDRELSQSEKKRGLKKDVVLTHKELTPDFIALGYSSTTHKFQGGSIERVYALAGGPMTNRNLAYVALSRSTEQCRLYIDQDHAGHKLSAISQAVDKHVEKRMAHELVLELKKT
jgi:ATP-dependent exoDNAse (exonuclease V) alpha subunit